MKLLEDLSQSMRDKVLREIGYTEESLREDMARLKSWARNQHHLPPSLQKEGDRFYAHFLVGCKGKISLAKKKIDQYYTARTSLRELHAVRDPAASLPHASTLYFCSMPKPTPDGSRITYVSVRQPDPEKFDLGPFIKRVMIVTELRLRGTGFDGGEWVVLDGQTFGAAHLLRFDLRLLKDLLHLTQFIYPARIKGIICINAPPFTESFINSFIKPFLGKKLGDRVWVYSGSGKELLNHFPKECVPKDFGGEAEEFKKLSDKWLDEAMSQRDLYLGIVLETVDEHKRPAKDPSSEELYGSFRKLEID